MAVAPLEPVVTGAARAAGTGVGKVFDLLNRPHEAFEAYMLDRAKNVPQWEQAVNPFAGAQAGLNTLVHGQSQASQDQTRAEMRQHLSIEPLYANMNQTERGLTDFAVDMLTDPLTFAGGSGALEHATEAVGAKTLPKFYRAIESLQASKNANARMVGDELAKAHDFLNFKGQQLRELGARHGEQGLQQFKGLKSIGNALQTHKIDLGNELEAQYNAAIKGLSSSDEGKLYDAIHTGTVDQLAPEMQARAAQFKQVYNGALAHLEGDARLRESLAQGFEKHGPTGTTLEGGGYVLPENLQRFEPAEGPRNLQSPEQFKHDYVPTAHDVRRFAEGEQPGSGGIGAINQDLTPSERAFQQTLDEIMGEPRQPHEAPTFEGVNTHDPNLMQRGNRAELLDPQLQRQVNLARLRGGARAIASADAEKQVAKLFGVDTWAKVPPAAQEFFRETYKGNPSIWQTLIDVPKVGLFASPVPHMMNIGNLAFLADPKLLATSAGKVYRLILAGLPEEARNKVFRYVGAPTGPAGEARAQIAGKAYQYGVTGVPSVDRAAGWAGKVPGLGYLYKLSNHVLWSFDDAVKATRFNHLLKRGMAGGQSEEQAAYQAADQVGGELIDYSNRSPLTHALANIVPFATYRTKVPGAIARAGTRHPERVLALGRASPEMIGDVQQAPPNDKGQNMVGKSYLPLAEVLRAAGSGAGLGEYARSSLGWPGQIAGSLAEDAFSAMEGKAPDPALSYGKVTDFKSIPGYALNATVGSFPGGEALLNKAGLSEWQNQGDIGGSIGRQTRFGLVRGPNEEELDTQRYVQAQQARADFYRSHGNAAAAKLIEDHLKKYLSHRYQFVP